MTAVLENEARYSSYHPIRDEWTGPWELVRFSDGVTQWCRPYTDQIFKDACVYYGPVVE